MLSLGGISASLNGGFRTVSVGEEMRLSGKMGVRERRKVLRRVTVLSFPVIVTWSCWYSIVYRQMLAKSAVLCTVTSRDT